MLRELRGPRSARGRRIRCGEPRPVLPLRATRERHRSRELRASAVVAADRAREGGPGRRDPDLLVDRDQLSPGVGDEICEVVGNPESELNQIGVRNDLLGDRRTRRENQKNKGRCRAGELHTFTLTRMRFDHSLSVQTTRFRPSCFAR